VTEDPYDCCNKRAKDPNWKPSLSEDQKKIVEEYGDDGIPHPERYVHHYLNLGHTKESAARYEICKSCPNFIDLTKQCKLCWCFMFIKCRIPSMECPDNPPRWGKSV
tara:strand:+ start:528 stop:848 length:321 start_codon:yes stop_codon:yes gene_type:complete